MWNILAVIPWAIAFHRNVTEDSVNDHGILRIIFTIRIVTRISCTRTMTLCMGYTGTSISLLCGSPGGRGHLFLGTACGSSFYTVRWLPAAHRPGGNWLHWTNSHVPLFGPFPCLWHIARLLSNKNFLLLSRAEFTSPIPKWKHPLSAAQTWTFVNTR